MQNQLKVFSFANFPKTALKIIEVLIRTKKKLTISEIANALKISERSVRSYISLLLKKGILRRELEKTKNKIAYYYYLESFDKILKAIRKELMRKIKTIEKISLKNENVIKA